MGRTSIASRLLHQHTTPARPQGHTAPMGEMDKEMEGQDAT